jgi:uncharacterized protein YecT (DUF1311 family)
MTNRKAGLIVLGAMLVVEPAAAAAPAPPDCFDTAMTQTAMNKCAGSKAQAADKKLSALLADLEKSLDPPQFKRLQAVQVEWDRFRKAHCEWVYKFHESGSIAPMEHSLCHAWVTNARVADLKIFLCEGAGMTGPCAASEKY